MVEELEKLKEKIANDFSFLLNDVLGVILFGSVVMNKSTPRSDIDVCVVVGTTSKSEVKRIFDNILSSGVTQRYDVKIFEMLPLHLKGEVLENGVIVASKDERELSYYLHKYRKMWQDHEIKMKKLGIKP